MSAILEDLCAISPKLKDKAAKARAELLESQLREAARRFLPNTEVREKVK